MTDQSANQQSNADIEIRTVADCWLVQEFKKRYSDEEVTEAIEQLRLALSASSPTPAPQKQSDTDEWLKMKCPACNGKTLFVGNGGYLTCSLVDCPEPDTEKALAAMKLDERMAELGKVTVPQHIGFTSPEDGEIYEYKIPAAYFDTRITELQKQKEEMA